MLARPLCGTDLGGAQYKWSKGDTQGCFRYPGGPVRVWLSVIEATSVIVVRHCRETYRKLLDLTRGINLFFFLLNLFSFFPAGRT